MDRRIAMLCIGLIFGCGIGFTIAAGNGITLDGHDHATDHGHSTQMAHKGSADGNAHHDHGEILAVPEGENQPELSLHVMADPMSGWNLHIRTENFRFAPERASLPHVPGEGHAHIYVNGEKVARHYGAWYHISSLPKGDNTIRVTLNSNDHRQLATGGEPLSRTVSVTAP